MSATLGLRAGDHVRLASMPSVDEADEATRHAILAALARLQRSYKRVDAVDAKGNAQITFSLRIGPHAGLHTLSIEPRHLVVRRR